MDNPMYKFCNTSFTADVFVAVLDDLPNTAFCGHLGGIKGRARDPSRGINAEDLVGLKGHHVIVGTPYVCPYLPRSL